jgi:hypothetical protein
MVSGHQLLIGRRVWIEQSVTGGHQTRLARAPCEPWTPVEGRRSVQVLPIVMSNGGPESTTTEGRGATPHRVSMVPPSDPRLRTSAEAGPYSPAKLYGFAGNVSLIARFQDIRAEQRNPLVDLRIDVRDHLILVVAAG